MIEMPCDERNVDVARFADRLAVVDALEHREKALALLDMPRERVEMTRPFVAAERRPFRQRLARGGDRRRDIRRRPLRDARDALARRGIVHVEQRAGG